MAEAAPLLAVDGLRVALRAAEGETALVRDVAFALDRGDTLGIVGESGSGKSITMLSVMGLLPSSVLRVAAGSIRLDGVELAGADEATYRRYRGRRIAMVYQDPMLSLNPVMRVGEQIEEGMRAHGVGRGDAARRALEGLAQVGIADAARVTRAFPHELSGGMCQRVMIASALSLRPDLLIMDEPTTALDVTIQQQIVFLVQRLQRETGIAVIWITHDLALLSVFAGRVAVMYGGRIVEESLVRTLFRTPAHPYTRALVASLPPPRGAERSRLGSIAGSPPDVHAMPAGCPFQPRCDVALERCAAEMPAMEVRGRDGRVACWAPLSRSAR